MTKTFCPLLFNQIVLRTDGRITPCCRFGKALIGDPISVFNEGYEEFRQLVRKGEEVEFCSRCYDEEKAGIRSYRQTALHEFPDLSSNDVPKLEFLEVQPGNRCNLKCRYCKPANSTSWISDVEDDRFTFPRPPEYNKPIDNNIDDLLEMDLSGLKVLRFTGGEPLIYYTQLKKIFLHLIGLGVQKNIRVEISTNSSFFPKQDLIDLLDQFRMIDVRLSIDIYGKRLSYLRHPLSWEEFENAYSYWRPLGDRSNWKIKAAISISIYNILYFDELHKWFKDNGCQNFGIQSIVSPFYLSTSYLPTSMKEVLIEKVSNMDLSAGVREKVLGFISIDRFDDQTIPLFLKYTKELDSIRNENFEDLFPELYKLLKEHL